MTPHDEYTLLRCQNGGWLLIGGPRESGLIQEKRAFTDLSDLMDDLARILEPKP